MEPDVLYKFLLRNTHIHVHHSLCPTVVCHRLSCRYSFITWIPISPASHAILSPSHVLLGHGIVQELAAIPARSLSLCGWLTSSIMRSPPSAADDSGKSYEWRKPCGERGEAPAPTAGFPSAVEWTFGRDAVGPPSSAPAPPPLQSASFPIFRCTRPMDGWHGIYILGGRRKALLCELFQNILKYSMATIIT